jgi:tRNA threonylcarbamoyladenosine biosynthesis protein TsaE
MEDRFLSNSEQDTIDYGKTFSQKIIEGDIIALYGDLGTGKTQFVKGLCSGLNISDTITSPTFTIMNIYKGKYTVNHFDLYRLTNSLEIFNLGINDFFFTSSITIMEWAEKAKDLLPDKRYDIFFEYGENENQRIIKYKKY